MEKSQRGSTTGALSAPPASAKSAASRLRTLLEEPGAARAAGAHDAISAILAERSGFDAIWASGFGVSASRGLPDIGLLGMTDYLQASVQMAAAISVPILADCDTGFGDSANLVHLVRSFEAAGIAGICIEDKVFPKRNSFLGIRQQLVDKEDFARKIAHAKAAQRDDSFVFVARTEGLICGEDLDLVLERAELYGEAGADAILVHSKSSTPDEVVEFLSFWSGAVPVIVVPTTYYRWSFEEAARSGVSLVIYANQALRASITGATEALASIMRVGSSAGVEPEIASMAELFELEGMDQWLGLNDDYV